MGVGGRLRRRIGHHLLLAVLVVAVGVPVGRMFGARDLRTQVSFATAYTGLGCIAVSLMIGPLNLLRRRPNPVSTDLRRDIGIWGALLGLVHVGFGLTVHLRGKMAQYFLPPPEARTSLPIRLDAFGIANHLGLISGAVLLLLLGISSDLALRRLGTARWKRWQQLNYVAAGTMALHGVLYQVVEDQRRRVMLAYGLVLVATLAMQMLGIRARRIGASGG